MIAGPFADGLVGVEGKATGLQILQQGWQNQLGNFQQKIKAPGEARASSVTHRNAPDEREAQLEGMQRFHHLSQPGLQVVGQFRDHGARTTPSELSSIGLRGPAANAAWLLYGGTHSSWPPPERSHPGLPENVGRGTS